MKSSVLSTNGPSCTATKLSNGRFTPPLTHSTSNLPNAKCTKHSTNNRSFMQTAILTTNENTESIANSKCSSSNEYNINRVECSADEQCLSRKSPLRTIMPLVDGHSLIKQFNSLNVAGQIDNYIDEKPLLSRRIASSPADFVNYQNLRSSLLAHKIKTTRKMNDSGEMLFADLMNNFEAKQVIHSCFYFFYS